MTVYSLPRKSTNKFADLLVKSFQHSAFVCFFFFCDSCFTEIYTVEHKRAIKTPSDAHCTFSSGNLFGRSSILQNKYMLWAPFEKCHRNEEWIIIRERSQWDFFFGFVSWHSEHGTLANCNRNYNNYKSAKQNANQTENLHIIAIIISYFYVIATHSFSLFLREGKRNANISRVGDLVVNGF